MLIALDMLDEASYTQSGTITNSAFSPPIRLVQPVLPLTSIHPAADQVTIPRLIPARPATPHPDSRFQIDRPESNLRHPGLDNSPTPSDPPSLASLTIRPHILGSKEDTLRPVPISPWKHAGKSSWQETDSRTARPSLPLWVSSLGHVKKVDEIDMEMCVLCGREMRRGDVTVKEFELGGAMGLQGLSGDEVDMEKRISADADLGLGRWMVCKDTADCDAAVEEAVFADDEDGSE
jgi:hypothetical protein